MNLSGLVLDVYDDFNGETLRAVYPQPSDIPDGVKQAHVIGAEERLKLPDDVFALVLVNGSETLRKYACIDEGNTILSMEYLMKNAHKLPLEAQVVAAENLKAACGWYKLDVPERLEKIALGLGTAMSALAAVPILKGTHQAIGENMAATRALEGAGAGVVTPQNRNAALGRKMAELSGTPVMPAGPPGNPSVTPSKTVVPKTASVGHLVAGHKGEHGDFGPEETDRYDGYTKGENVSRAPQAGNLRPVVNVTGKSAPRMHIEKKATILAMPSQGKYPLDSYVQVKTASGYFDEYYKHMSPPARREFAANLVKRASELAISVSDTAKKYGSDSFAPEAEIKAAFDARRLELSGDTEVLALLDQVERVARVRMWKEGEKVAQVDSPDLVVALLEEFDKAAGLNRCYDSTVPDPYFSIFGFEKDAEDGAAWSDLIGNDSVTAADLKRLAKIGAAGVKQTFGADFQEEFLKDPVGIYKSLPLDQKKMLMRMANSTQPGAERVY